MNFICALIPLCSVAVSLSYGGGTSPFVLAETIILLPLLTKLTASGRGWILLVPLSAVSAVLRFTALYTLARESIGSMGGIFAAAVCIALSGWSAYNGKSALYSPAPVFFLTALLAVYVTAVSLGSPLREGFPIPRTEECISAAVCPLSLTLAFSRLNGIAPMKCYKSAVAGVALSAVFLIFGGAGAEFGFICVPLTVCAAALEIKAVSDVILTQK